MKLSFENIQKRALRMIYSDTDSDYKISLIVTRMDSLKDRREMLMARFLRSRSSLVMLYSTTYYLNHVTMTLYAAWEILNLSINQSSHN